MTATQESILCIKRGTKRRHETRIPLQCVAWDGALNGFEWLVAEMRKQPSAQQRNSHIPEHRESRKAFEHILSFKSSQFSVCRILILFATFLCIYNTVTEIAGTNIHIAAFAFVSSVVIA
jgi:hypothetical protein